jgi:hypothetical protein
VATPIDPDGEFLTTPSTMEVRLRDAQRTLLGVHAPFSDIVAKPYLFDPAGIDRIRALITALDTAIRREAHLVTTPTGGWGEQRG